MEPSPIEIALADAILLGAFRRGAHYAWTTTYGDHRPTLTSPVPPSRADDGIAWSPPPPDPYRTVDSEKKYGKKKRWWPEKSDDWWAAPGAPDFMGADYELVITMQVRFGSYRIDLLVDLWHGGRAARMAVECDGHEFHERTKEQAAHDRKRDRFFLERGLDLMRFTGFEIHRDADALAAQVVNHLKRKLG